MSEKYDIFFAGKIVDGFDEATARANVAKLFKANPQTVEKLFSGKPQLIKRGVDKPAAIKYKAAMQKAGAVPLIRAHAAAKPAGKPAPAAQRKAQPAAGSGKPEKQSMAERLAAITGENAASEKPAAAASPVRETRAAPGQAQSAAGAGMSLAPVGSDVLREEEREPVEAPDIDTSAIQLAPENAAPAAAEPPPAPAPDVSHLSMGEVGEEIPQLRNDQVELDPDISHLSMGDLGEEIPHLELDVEIVEVDISGFDLAPEGSDVLEAQYRKRDDAPPPDTDHISLEN